MNFHVSIISIFFFSIPFVFQNYVFIVKLGYKSYSPYLSLIACNLQIIVLSVYFMWKNANKSLNDIIKQMKIGSREELLSLDSFC